MSEGNSYGNSQYFFELGRLVRRRKKDELMIRIGSYIEVLVESTEGFGRADDFLRELDTLINSFNEEHPVA